MSWQIFAVAGAIYLVGVYALSFVNGYFDQSDPASAVFWPLYAGFYMVIGAMMPFVWVGALLYGAGSAVRGKR